MSVRRSQRTQCHAVGIFLLAAFVTVAFAGPARAQSSSASFDQANRAFSQGRYAEAAADFEAIARSRGWSAALLYDLANAYAQQGKVGQSILSYERARVLAPRDADIAANLAYVRAKAGLSIPTWPWYERLARSLTPTTWTLLAVVGFCLAGVGFVAARRWRRQRLVYAAAFAALLGVTAVSASVILEMDLNHAVVVERKSAPVRVSPFDTSASEVALSEGEDVSILGRHGDFVRVRDGNGRSGWVQSGAVQPVFPRRS
jgi:SH3-like domain-containing protein